MAQTPGGDGSEAAMPGDVVSSEPVRQNPPIEKEGGGPDAEARIARLEAHVEHILTVLTEIRSDIRDIKIRDIKREPRTDFRVLFGVIIFVALGLALMARGFNWL